MATMDALPDDVLLIVFSYCPHRDLVRSVQNVCKRWAMLSRRKCVWNHVWFCPARTTPQANVLELLRSSPRLQLVDLGRYYPNAGVIAAVAEFCPELRVLRLPLSVNFSLETELDLLQEKCPDLEELTAPCAGVREPHIMDIIKKFSKLKALHLPYFPFTSADVDVIGRHFPHLQHLQLQEYSLAERDLLTLVQHKGKLLRGLSAMCALSDGGCVLPLLGSFSRLETLSLQDLCASTDTFPALESVRALSIACSNLHGHVALLELVPNVSALTVATSSYPPNLVDVLAVCCPLVERLLLHSGSMTDDVLLRLHRLPRLNSLTVSCSASVTDRGVQYLQQVPQLTYLKFSDVDKITLLCLPTIASFKKLRVIRFDRCAAMRHVKQGYFKTNFCHAIARIEN